MGRVSLVAMHANSWAEEMANSFIGEKSNPELSRLLEQNRGRLQRVDINIAGDWMRALIVRMFSARIRETIPEERWSSYFKIKLPRDIRRGLTDEARDAMGFLNTQVGYVYLVDSSCKIRWAGSAYAWDGEVDGLNAAVRRLLQEERTLGEVPSKPLPSSASTVQRPRVPPKTSTGKPNAMPNAAVA
jgi:ATPase complex subunit ATP10